jgi:hypothetical protein
MTNIPSQPNPGNNPELIGFRVDGGPNDGRIVIEEGADSVSQGTPGVLSGLPKVEPRMREEGIAVVPDIDTDAPIDDGANRYSSFVTELSRKRKEDLSNEELIFIDRLADFGSRTVSYLFSSRKARIPTSIEYAEAAREYKKAAYGYFQGRKNVGSPKGEDYAGFGLDPDSTVAVLDKFSNSTPNSQDNEGSLRGPVVECAKNIAVMLDEVVKENGIDNPDAYMIGNLDNIASHYERAIQPK